MIYTVSQNEVGGLKCVTVAREHTTWLLGVFRRLLGLLSMLSAGKNTGDHTFCGKHPLLFCCFFCSEIIALKSASLSVQICGK